MSDLERVVTHFKDAIEASGNGNKWRFVRVDIIEDVVKLLKEQEPIEPSATDSGVRIEYNCGSCGRWFCFKSKIHPEMDFRTRYCPHCGRKAKW